jgi:hydroxymethylpyrimidine pyrophosphatase-like HAD family hydrolase
MRHLALACDYDETLATDGCVPDATLKALERLRLTGRRLVLVTGRELEELDLVFDGLDVFDRVVAENGALVYDPSTADLRTLAERPPAEFVAALCEQGVQPLSVGHVIVATREPYRDVVLETIREMRLPVEVFFNRGAVMVLPSGLNKAVGLATALSSLGLPPNRCVGIGDAENDLEFLSICGTAVAVSNAIPALQARVQLVTLRPRGEGVADLVDALIGSDLREADRAALEPLAQRAAW